MATNNTYYGKNHKKLQLLQLLDGATIVEVVNSQSQVIGTEVIMFDVDFVGMKLDLRTQVDITVPALQTITRVRVIGKNGEIRGYNTNIETGNNPTVYSILDMEVKL